MKRRRKITDPIPSRVRNPGRSFELTDEELLSVPPGMLNSEQRKRRRQLRARIRVEKAEKIRRQKREGTYKRVGTCAAYTKSGEPCHGFAIKGAKHCISHLNEAEQAKLGMKSLHQMGSEARVMQAKGRENATATQTAREIMEMAQDKLINRQYAALGMEFIGFDENGHPVIIDHGAESGVCIYGVSKEGDVVMSRHPDLGAQFGLVEKLFDRTYGRPRQTTVLEGGQRPVQVQPVHDVERAKKVADMLAHVGAVDAPHEGRRRPQAPATERTERTGNDSNVVPLQSDK